MRMLNEIREDINRVDNKIRKLFAERMKLAEQVAEYKLETNDKVLKPDRETALIKMMSDKVYSASKNSYDSGFEAAKDKYDNNGDDTIAYENGYEDGYC